MAKFSSIARGVRARRRVTVPMPDGPALECDVVPLLVPQVLDALAGARADSIARGLKDPRDGDPIYEMSKWAHVVTLACVDPDSPQDDPSPYFDGGVKQVLDSKSGLDRDRLALLYVTWEQWQAECAPQPEDKTPAEYLAAVLDNVQEDHSGQLPFRRWQLATQDSFVRFMASLLTDVLRLKSLFGPGSAETSTSFDESASLLAKRMVEAHETNPPSTDGHQ